jgi:GNAT superfamily N-acetyltransferase
MSEISNAIRGFAEEPDCYVAEPLEPARRIRTAAFTLILSPSRTLATVSGVRTSAEDLDRTLAEVQELVRQGGHARTAWTVGPSSRPAGLAQMLLERGFVPATRSPLEPEATAMALVQAPPPPPEGVEARRVRDLEEYLQTWRIALETFNASEEDAAGWLAVAPELWKQQDCVDRFTYVALVDDRPVGFAFALGGPCGLLLGGSGVLEASRGRGAYRALLAARWTEAVRLGKPALVIQAGAMSRPILERSGFESLCRIDVLEDPVR